MWAVTIAQDTLAMLWQILYAWDFNFEFSLCYNWTSGISNAEFSLCFKKQLLFNVKKQTTELFFLLSFLDGWSIKRHKVVCNSMKMLDFQLEISLCYNWTKISGIKTVFKLNKQLSNNFEAMIFPLHFSINYLLIDDFFNQRFFNDAFLSMFAFSCKFHLR